VIFLALSVGRNGPKMNEDLTNQKMAPAKVIKKSKRSKIADLTNQKVP
jgi:hypothetical protein